MADIKQFERNIIRDYGAIDNTSTYPLSNKFITLALAQAAYPNAGVTALTQELNWAAFQQAFYDVTYLKYRLTIPVGSYYIKSPLTIGTNQSGSIEYGSGVVIGSGMQSTQLLFDIQTTTEVAISVIGNTQKLEMSNFNLKNLTSKKGIGIKVEAASTLINIDKIQTFNMYIGFDSASYVATISNCYAGYGSCGFKINNGTACTFSSCYASNNRKVDVNDTADYAGCNWFIAGVAYSSFNNCGSDSGDFAYKIKGTNINTITFNSCGTENCAEAWYIDNPNAKVVLNSPSVYLVTNQRIAHVENALSVLINSLSESGSFKVTRGLGVGVGVIRFVNSSLDVNNPAQTPDSPTTVDRSVWGLQDFVWDRWSYGASDGAQEGRMIYKGGTNIELTLIPYVGNGKFASLSIDTLSGMSFTDTSTAFKRGNLGFSVSNNGGTISYFISQANANWEIWNGWNKDTAYVVGGKVEYLGNCYYCTVNCTGIVPTDAGYWSPVTNTNSITVRPHRTETYYNVATAYVAGNLVQYHGNSYICTSACTNITPNNISNWSLTTNSAITGYTVLFQPLLTNGTNQVFFYVTALINEMQKNHNIKTTGTYTGRVSVKLKGVDY